MNLSKGMVISWLTLPEDLSHPISMQATNPLYICHVYDEVLFSYNTYKRKRFQALTCYPHNQASHKYTKTINA